MTRTRKLLLALAGAGVLVVIAGSALVLSFDPNRYKGPAIAYMAEHYQRRLVLEGPIALRVFPRIEVALERVSLSEPGQPELAFAQLASARLAVQLLPLLRKQLVVDRVEASGLQLRYRRDAAGRRNFDDLLTPQPAPSRAPAEPGKTAPPMQLAIRAIELQRLTLDVDDRKVPARGQVRLASFSSGPLGAGTPAPVQLSAAADFAQPAVKAQLDGQLDLQLDLGDAARPLRMDARALSLRLQGTLPGLPRIDTKLEGALAYQGSGAGSAALPTARWQLTGMVNAQAFQTRGDATLGGARPKVQAEARFGELDLGALLPRQAAPAATAAAAAPPSRGGPVVDRPVNLAALRSLDGRIALQADTLRSAPYVLHHLQAVATLDDGRLDLSPLSFDTWDGAVSARLQASAADRQSVALALQAQHIDIARVLHDVAQSDLLEGRGELTLDLRSSGRSVQALKGALAGDARLQLRDGAVRGFNLAQAVRQFQAALALQPDAVSPARQAEKTDFSELSASLRFTGGVGTNRDLDLKSPFLRVTGEGLVNLPASRLDYTLRTAVTNTSKGQGGADVAALHGLVVPVRAEGPFDALNWRVQWSQVAAGATGTTVKQQLGDQLRKELRGQLGLPAASDAASQPSDAELRDKAREKLKEQLKGLLR